MIAWKKQTVTLGLAASSMLLSACSTLDVTDAVPAVTPTEEYAPTPYVQVDHPEWTRNAVIYQINTRQFTEAGTFAAAQTHLPRLAELGVDILWLMPIHPIGVENRKGSLGSPYAVYDYREVNPEFGTKEEFKAFVDAAHGLGMRIILDWVANHSAWDNPLTETDPDWYSRSPEGELMPTLGTDWTDIVEFDYANPDLRRYMTESLIYWVEEMGVDGYRADVAGTVPLDFWETARAKLDAVKPVFLLAEWEQRDLHQHAFDATYAWSWKEAMHQIARDGGTGPLLGFYFNHWNTWPADAYRMVYTSNHDQNAWDGVAADIFGDFYEAAIVMSFVGEGMPLIYNGQEADLDHQLEFFEKDQIVWREGQYADLFRELIDLKHSTKALWNGAAGAPVVIVPNTAPETVLSFVRAGDEDRVFAVFNLSDEPAEVRFELARHHGNYLAFGTDEATVFDGDEAMSLPAWGWRVFVAPDTD